MKEGIIRKKFNQAVKDHAETPEGKNTLRVLFALKEVTLGLREEGFEATLETRHGATGVDECFNDEETQQAAANGEITVQGETLPFMLWDDGYSESEMYFKIAWQGREILSLTSTWDTDRQRWDDTFNEEYDEDEDTDGGYEDDSSPAKQPAKKVKLEGKIADALIDVLAKVDLVQRHSVTGEEGLDKTFKVPAQIKINGPKGTP